MIRDPFYLHVSTYFYVRNQAASGGMGAYRGGKLNPIVENDWSLEEYLRHNNQSCIRSFLPPNLALENYVDVLSNSFIYIGVSENLQKSVDLLAERLGFDSVEVPKKNVSDWSEEVPHGARERFEEANPLETLIYR